jgi:hypothetical protein
MVYAILFLVILGMVYGIVLTTLIVFDPFPYAHTYTLW